MRSFLENKQSIEDAVFSYLPLYSALKEKQNHKKIINEAPVTKGSFQLTKYWYCCNESVISSISSFIRER